MMPHSTTLTPSVTIAFLLLTLIPSVQSTEYHQQQSYQTVSALALRLARWRERACGSSPDFLQQPPDLRRVWVSVGHALMAGLGCDDREHACPGRPSCLQLITQTVEEIVIKNRHTRQVAEMTQGRNLVNRHSDHQSHHSQANHNDHEHSQNVHRPHPQAQHGKEPPIPGNSHEDGNPYSTDQNEHPLDNHRSHEPRRLRGPLRVSAESQQGSRHHEGFFSSQQDFNHKPATLTIQPVHHESQHLHDEGPGDQMSHLIKPAIASNSGLQGSHPKQPSSDQHPDHQTSHLTQQVKAPNPGHQGSHLMQQVKAPTPGHQRSHPNQQTMAKEPVHASLQEHPDGQPRSLSHGHQPAFLNQSMLVTDVFFAAVAHVSTAPEQCGPRAPGYRLSPRVWVDGVCGQVEAGSGISEIVQREVRTLRQIVKKAFGKWRPERFLSGVPSLDSDQFLEQRKCFNVLLLEEGPHRVTVLNCRHEMHDFIRRLSLAILTRLLQGHRPVLTDQPCEADFLRDVLDKYGAEKDHRVFSVEGVQKMVDIMEARINCSREGGPSASRSGHLGQLTMGHQSANRSAPDQHGVRNKRHGFHEDKEPVLSSSHGHHSVNKRFSAGELVNMVLDNRTLTVNVQQFYRLCPALLQQLLLMMTTRPEGREPSEAGSDFFADGDGDDDRDAVRATPVQTYGLGTACVGVLVLCSLLGALVVRGSEALGGHSATVTLLAVTVGQLCGQAMLHLLPNGLGHGLDKFKDDIANGDDNNDDDSVYHLAGGFVIDDVSVKCLGVLGGVYLFWLLEIITCHYYQSAALRPQSVDKQPDRSDYEMGHHQKQPTASSTQEKYYSTFLVAEVPGHLVWLVVAGGTVHNLVQGLTIGAAYVHSVPHGLSAAAAVVCRDIPHEIGDFVVLLSTGMKVKTALLINLLSALAAFLGLYVALGTGEDLLPALDWFYLLLAGIFLYISLACLIPELVRHFRHCGNSSTFIWHNLGLLGGFSLMFFILLSERKMQF